MPRALQSLTVTFGLVTIPVKLYAATDPKGRIHFNFLHTCGSRVTQQYRCVAEDRDVPRSELVKAYEFEKDRFVTFSKEELDALEEAASGAVEITEFVAQETVDPVYYERAYYLAPDKGGAKPYALLLQAMRESGRTAIGRWAARGKQYLVQLRVAEHGLVLQQLLYGDEIRPFEEVEIPPAKVNEAELKLARQLIDSITSDQGFEAGKYDDDVKARVEALIAQKVAGREITAPEAPAAPEGARVIDLMEALRASLKGGRSDRSPANDEAPAPAGRKPPRAARPAPAPRAAAERARPKKAAAARRPLRRAA
jgi:DNA end-binding protein Ku